MEHSCETPNCRMEINEKISDAEKEIAKKMDRDGPEGAFAIFQKVIPWKWAAGILISVVVVVGGAVITTGYNVYSSEFKFAKKDDVSEFKENTIERLKSVEKDNESICKTLNTIQREQSDLRTDVNQKVEEIKKMIETNNEHQKELAEQQMKSMENLVKSFHRDNKRTGE